jgi:hypothetical protein
MTRKAQLIVRVDTADLAKLKSDAAGRGLSLSDHVRVMLALPVRHKSARVRS